jgi:hypothetical protein
MKKGWKIFFGLLSTAVITSILVVLLNNLTPEPPVAEMEYAREVISRSWHDKADTYSRKLYQEAKNAYDSAMANWKRENTKFIYFRNYGKVQFFAGVATEKAIQASVSSRESTSKLSSRVAQKIESLNIIVNDINKLFASYPLTPEVRSRISRGKMLLKESEVEFSRGHFLLADRKLTDSEYLLVTSLDNANSNLKTYFNSFPLWKKWVDITIAGSKAKRDYSIIVDKYARKVFVYLAGKKKYEFSAELGMNWVGDKRVSGDKATPEGMYKITRKIDSGRTKYYKALLIDYPNAEDSARFKEELKNGNLPLNAKIGGLIEIHGNGGRGIDWTDGCVALTDKEMDIIYKIVKIGTPVTIVGSMYDLQSVLKR